MTNGQSKMTNKTKFAFPVGETFNIEETIKYLQHKIDTNYTTPAGNCWGDYKMTVDMKFTEDGVYKGTGIRLVKNK